MSRTSHRIANAIGAGKGLFSETSLRPGDTIFELKRPLLTALDTPALEYTCEWCFDGVGEAALGQNAAGEEKSLSRCMGCKIVKYCSKTCQTQAWKHHHKLECKLYAALAPRVLPHSPRMLLQLLLRKQKGLLSESDWNSFQALQHHVDKFRNSPTGPGDRQKLQVTAMAAKQYSGLDRSLEYFEEHAARIYINAQTLVNAIYHPLGQCLDPLPASINHSCMPNAVIVFSGPVMTLRATTPISKDEEVTISYIDFTLPTQQRQAQLGGRYFFECKCRACVENLAFGMPLIPTKWGSEQPMSESQQKSLLKSFSELDSAALKHQTKADEIFRTGRLTTGQGNEMVDSVDEAYYLELCRGLSLYLQQDCPQQYPPGRQPLAKLRFDVTVEFLARQLFVPALIFSLQNYYDVDPLHFSYPCHPVRVVHVYVLSKLIGQIYFMSLQGDEDVCALRDHFFDNTSPPHQWQLLTLALLGETVRCMPQSHGIGSRLMKLCSEEAMAVATNVAAAAARDGVVHAGNASQMSPEAIRRLALGQDQDPAVPETLGARNPENWGAVMKLAQEGWQWYGSQKSGIRRDAGLAKLMS